MVAPFDRTVENCLNRIRTRIEALPLNRQIEIVNNEQSLRRLLEGDAAIKELDDGLKLRVQLSSAYRQTNNYLNIKVDAQRVSIIRARHNIARIRKEVQDMKNELTRAQEATSIVALASVLEVQINELKDLSSGKLDDFLNQPDGVEGFLKDYERLWTRIHLLQEKLKTVSTMITQDLEVRRQSTEIKRISGSKHN